MIIFINFLKKQKLNRNNQFQQYEFHKNWNWRHNEISAQPQQGAIPSTFLWSQTMQVLFALVK